jgi:hypothetical protein
MHLKQCVVYLKTDAPVAKCSQAILLPLLQNVVGLDCCPCSKMWSGYSVAPAAKCSRAILLPLLRNVVGLDCCLCSEMLSGYSVVPAAKCSQASCCHWKAECTVVELQYSSLLPSGEEKYKVGLGTVVRRVRMQLGSVTPRKAC